MVKIRIPKTGNLFSFWVTKRYQAICFGQFFRYSSVSGLYIRKPLVQKKTMLDLLRWYEFVKMDNMTDCKKCLGHVMHFYTSMRNGDEIDYSGYYKRTFLDILLRRKI